MLLNKLLNGCPVPLRRKQMVRRIAEESAAGLDKLSDLGPAVSIFGTARCERGSPEYQRAYRLAYMLARAGFAIISGGGPGIMEAANAGAAAAGGIAVGVNIKLPREEKPNEFQNVSLDHLFFQTRKLMFVEHSIAFINMPGGFGTLDELTEVLTLIQCKCADRAPVFLMDSNFWGPFAAFLEKSLLGNGYISEDDLRLFQVSDDEEDVVRQIVSFYEQLCPADKPVIKYEALAPSPSCPQGGHGLA